MKLGCCIGIEYYDLLAEIGFDSITLAGVDVAAWSNEEFARELNKLQSGALQVVSLNSFCPTSLRLTGSDVRPESIQAYTIRLCERAAKMGVQYIGIGAPKSRNVGPGNTYSTAWRQLQDAFHIICNEAARFDIDILLESVCSYECNLITTTQLALRFLREMNLENLHLVYDVYHEAAERQPISVIADAGDEIRVVHIAQNVHNERCYLDPVHGELYRTYLNALREIDYQGEFNLEAMTGDPKIELPKSYRIIKSILEGEQ